MSPRQLREPRRYSTLAAIAAPVVHFGGDESATGVVNGPVVEPRVGSIERRLEPATASARRRHTPSGRVQTGFDVAYSRAVNASRM
jgi:hypothetical protein